MQIGPHVNELISQPIANCVAIGNDCKATCCEGAIALGDGVVATIENPHVIGESMFGLPIPEEVKAAFKQNPQAAVWLIRACADKLQSLFEEINQ